MSRRRYKSKRGNANDTHELLDQMIQKFILYMYIHSRFTFGMGVELISMGRRKPEGGTTGVPMLRTGLSYSAEVQLLHCCMPYVPGMRSNNVYSTVAPNALVLSWLDLLLPCTSHTHIHRDYWHKSESSKRGCRCIAAAVLLLYCCILLLWLLGWAAGFQITHRSS